MEPITNTGFEIPKKPVSPFSPSLCFDYWTYVLPPCYHDSKKEDTHMSVMFGAKKNTYVVLASDSRIVDKNQEILSDCKRKILTFPDDQLMVGYTGMYDYRFGNIEEIIGNVLKHTEKKEHAVLSLKEMLSALQKELKPGQVMDLHMVQILDNELQYAVMSNHFWKTVDTTVWGNGLMQTGVPVKTLPDIQDTENEEADVTMLKSAVQTLCADENEKSVGGPVQCFVLRKDGTIYDYSDKSIQKSLKNE